MYLVFGLGLTSALIAAVENRRVSLLALSAQYILAGLLLSEILGPWIGSLKIFVGAMIYLILYGTTRPPPQTSTQTPQDLGRNLLSSRPFRLLSIALAGILAYSLFRSYPLPKVTPEVNLGCYWLVTMGLLTAIWAGEPLKVGLGLLTFEGGFELFYTTQEKSLSVMGLLGIANLLVALAIAYLVSAQESSTPEEGGGEKRV